MPVLHPDADPSVCWQRQVRDRYLSEGTPPVPHLDLKRSVVRPVSRKLAERIILRYEWLGRMAPTSFHFGLFFGPYCSGVTCVGSNVATAGFHQHRRFRIDSRSLLILARGACVHWAPKGTNSRLVSWTCRFLARERCGRLIVAYADTDAGEVGTIYQACNWTYVGATSRPHDAEIVSPRGVRRNGKSLTDWARKSGTNFSGMRAALLDAGWRFRPSNPKMIYACVLDRSDRDLVARIESMRLPYPKRAGRLDGEAPVDQTG
jgi:hypothetical protein